MTLTPRQVADGARRDRSDRPALDRRRAAALDARRIESARVAFVAARPSRKAPRRATVCRTDPRPCSSRTAVRSRSRVARTAHRLGMRVIGIHAPDDRPPAGTDEAHEIPALPGRRGDPRGRGARRGRCGPSRATGSSPRTRSSPDQVTAAGLALGRAARRGDRRDGRQGRGSPARGRPRRPDGPRLRRRGAGRRDAGRRGGAHRLPRCSSSPAPAAAARACASSASPGELTESLAAARREAHRSFGDDRLILERYLEGVRHVEVQVLFDATGRGRPPRRARLLGPATQPEDRRGVAGAIGHPGASRAGWATRPSRSHRPPAT